MALEAQSELIRGLESRRRAAARRSRAHRLKQWLAYTGLTLVSVLMIVPFYYMLVLALQERGGATLFNWPPPFVPVWPLQLGNFVYVFELAGYLPFGRFYLNSTLIAVLSVVGTLLSSSIAGFTFARLRFRGRDTIFLIMLATLMVPPQVTLIPQFILFRTFNWYDTFYPLWVPSWTGSAFAIFLLRQYFKTMPTELEDAARIDGANPFTIFWRIFLPLSGPILATIAVLVFLSSWNDLLGPIVYLSSIENYTVQIGLHWFNGSTGTSVDIVNLMAASAVALLPSVAVFTLAQRFFVRGVVLTGLKG